MSATINLANINALGEDFTYDNSDRGMKEVLHDIVNTQDFRITLHILPAGGAYDAKGTIVAGLPETCSLCAKDFVEPVQIHFHEILMVGMKVKTDLKGSETDFEDPDLSLTQLTDTLFDVGEFMRELIALSEPTQPKCRPDCRGLCLGCAADLNFEKCQCAAKPTPLPEVKSSVFSVLKNLKLN